MLRSARGWVRWCRRLSLIAPDRLRRTRRRNIHVAYIRRRKSLNIDDYSVRTVKVLLTPGAESIGVYRTLLPIGGSIAGHVAVRAGASGTVNGVKNIFHR